MIVRLLSVFWLLLGWNCAQAEEPTDHWLVEHDGELAPISSSEKIQKVLHEVLNDESVPRKLRNVLRRVLVERDPFILKMTNDVLKELGLKSKPQGFVYQRGTRVDSNGNAVRVGSDYVNVKVPENSVTLTLMKNGIPEKWIRNADFLIDLVYLNPDLSKDMMAITLVHELSHVRFNSFFLVWLKKITKPIQDPFLAKVLRYTEGKNHFVMDANVFQYLTEKFAWEQHVELYLSDKLQYFDEVFPHLDFESFQLMTAMNADERRKALDERIVSAYQLNRHMIPREWAPMSTMQILRTLRR